VPWVSTPNTLFSHFWTAQWTNLPKLPLSVGGLWLWSNTTFIKSLHPNRTSICSAVSVQQSHMNSHDRLTDTGIIDRNSPHLMHSTRANRMQAWYRCFLQHPDSKPIWPIQQPHYHLHLCRQLWHWLTTHVVLTLQLLDIASIITTTVQVSRVFACTSTHKRSFYGGAL